MRYVLLIVTVLMACGSTDKTVRRAMLTDSTPLGAPRMEVRGWMLDNDWCQRRTWESSEEYRVCVDRTMRRSGRVHAVYRFEADRMVAAAMFAPVPCGSRPCGRVIGVDTSLAVVETHQLPY